MTCAYPDCSRLNAYRKGCRCDECRAAKSSEGRKRSRVRPCRYCGSGTKQVGDWYCAECRPFVAMRRISERILIDGNGCWVYPGTRNRDGYCPVASSGRYVGVAHRIMYEGMVGPVPNGLVLDHTCEVRNCVNPDHLEPVTAKENVRRSFARGRR